jgi:hypothetical protein
VASIAEKSLAAAGLFEAEVLTELLLWRWDHPSKNDTEFRENLLEDAATVLRRAIAGERFIESVPPAEMNLIAAVWYVEWNTISSGEADPEGSRQRWLSLMRRALPSCFCSQADLPPI